MMPPVHVVIALAEATPDRGCSFMYKELNGGKSLDIFNSLALVVDELRYVVVCCDWFGNDCL